MAAAESTAGIALAAGTITLTGSVFGVHYDALLAGFFGGLVWLSYQPKMPASRIAVSVSVSSLFAGFFAPVVAAGGVNYFPWIASLGDFNRMAAAAALGIAAQVLIPVAFNWIRIKGGSQ